MGSCGVLSVKEYSTAAARGLSRSCREFAATPSAGWVTLEGCELDFDLALVGDAQGYERLADRLEGKSRALRESPPTWREVLVPLVSHELSRSPARAVVVLLEPEVLAIVNRLERGSDDERLRALQDAAGLQRWRSLGRVQAEGAKDEGAVQRALGRSLMPGAIVLRPATVPVAQVPVAAIVCGLLGLVAFLWAWVARQREPELGQVGVGDVPLELGQLESLRQERARLKSKRP